MGLLSFTTIILSLACLAILIGLVFVIILIWPQNTHNQPDNRLADKGPPRQNLVDQGKHDRQ